MVLTVLGRLRIEYIKCETFLVCFSDDWAAVLRCITSSRSSEKKSRNSEQFDKFQKKKSSCESD